MTTPDLVATCWTTAGNVGPLDQPETSPYSALERVQAAAATGWAGLGFAADDLRVVKDTIGFPALRREIETVGLSHVEVELVTSWWKDDSQWRETWSLLTEAAQELGAPFIKAGTEFGPPARDLTPFVEPFRRLAEEADRIGVRLALEPLPFAAIASMPQGAELIRAVDHPAAGLIVDFWHVFRADTTLPQLLDCLDANMVVGVELCDARTDIVGTLFEDTRNRRTLIGEGDQDVVGFIQTMQRIGFNGPWGVEIISDEHRQRPLLEALTATRATTLAAFAMTS
jgi:sugar phosphate isomerase/epimerase